MLQPQLTMKREELLEFIKKNFPRHERRIELLYKENEDFRTLCTDFKTCTESLGKFKKSISDNEIVVSDFQTVLKDLEKEIYSFIY